MGFLLRRILWLLPTVLVVTVFAFWLASGAGPASGSRSLPKFVNLNPQDSAQLAWSAAQRVARGEDASAQAQLVWLGGATLPHILPRLDSLHPEGRERVALALIPVAARMGLLNAEPNPDGAHALALWLAFWEEHFVDFRAARVKRAVDRYTDRATRVRAEELVHLDTFVLDELMDRLARLSEQTDASSPARLQAIRRLTAAAAHATAQAWLLDANPTPENANAVTARWLSWWAEHRFEFTAPQGVERFLAPLMQTQYASWARESARAGFGTQALRDAAMWQAAKGRLRISVALFIFGLLGMLCGYFSATLARVTEVQYYPALTKWLYWLLLPVGAIALGLSQVSANAACFLWSICMVAAHQDHAAIQALDAGVARAYQSMGLHPLRTAWLLLRSGSCITFATLVPNCARLFAAICALEYAFGMPGVGQYAVLAVQQRDVNALMLLTISGGALFGLLQLLSELLSFVLTPALLRDAAVTDGVRL